MTIKPNEFVVKISVSNMEKSRDFYEKILGFKEQTIYTINAGGHYGPESYMQLQLRPGEKSAFSLGLYKDIEAPFTPLPQTGSVPSFIVNDIDAALRRLKAEGVTIDSMGGATILTNVSDKGYEDKFFFFRDPDNNSLVMRQNFGQVAYTKKAD